MKNAILSVLLFSTLIFFVKADGIQSESQNNGECEFQSTEKEEEFYSNYNGIYLYTLGLAESHLSNIVLWSFNRYGTQSDYGMISFESMRDNLSHSWVWDQDEFSVNHIGHPYQGSIYYNAARSTGNSFWPSASIAALGSISWELFMETETPSYNDLFVTTVGGISFGEMLFRLSDVFLFGEDGNLEFAGPHRWAAASILSPMTTLNQALMPERPGSTAHVKGAADLAMGYSFLNINDDPENKDLYNDHGFSLRTVLDLEYGSPFIRNGNPYDWFSFRGSAGVTLNSELYAALFSQGYLGGWTLYGPHENARNQLGFYLHYDFIINRFVNLGANSIGLGWIRKSDPERPWTLDWHAYINYVMIGASDIMSLKVDDINGKAPEYERRSYNLCYGLNQKGDLTLAYRNSLFFETDISLYQFFIIEDAVPEEGSGGFDHAGQVDLRIRYEFPGGWYTGLGGNFFFKDSTYNSLPDLEMFLWNTYLFTGVRF